MRKVNTKWIGKCTACGKLIQGPFVICWSCWDIQDIDFYALAANLVEIAEK